MNPISLTFFFALGLVACEGSEETTSTTSTTSSSYTTATTATMTTGTTTTGTGTGTGTTTTGTGTTTTSTSTSTTTTSAFAPNEGIWEIRNLVSTIDECGFDVSKGDVIRFQLTMLDQSSFNLVDVDGSKTINFEYCALEQMGDDITYGCDPLNGGQSMKGLDAILQQEFLVDGIFENASEATWQASIIMSCKGSDCDAAAKSMEMTWPCETAFGGAMTPE